MDKGASSSEDRAADPSDRSRSVSGKASIPCAGRSTLHNAQAVAKAAADYARRIEESPGNLSTTYARLELCEAIMGWIDEGDAGAEAENLRRELGIDREGYPLDANGFRLDKDLAYRKGQPDGSWEWAA